jgi:hypothetical protein
MRDARLASKCFAVGSDGDEQQGHMTHFLAADGKDEAMVASAQVKLPRHAKAIATPAQILR